MPSNPSDVTEISPVISVIIPTFNRAGLIRQAIESVLQQSFVHFELIVVDDGSTDSTADVVDSFSDRRLIFLKQGNKGRSAARNKGISIARGKYIAFLDSDDLYLKDKLERQVGFMDAHPDVGMIYTSAHCIDDQGNLLNSQVYMASVEGQIYKEIAFFQPVTITLPTVMVRREVLVAIGGFDETMERFEDTDLWRRIAKKYKIGLIKQPTCLLRTHEDNALKSQDPSRIVSAIEYYVGKIFREDADVGIEFLRAGASRLYEYYGRALLSIPGWRNSGILLLRKSIALEPKRTVVIMLAGLRSLAGSLLRHSLMQVK